MNLILTAVEKTLADGWRKFCGNLNFVTIHHGSILDVECDAIVSPANSFGFMDGGIDAIYLSHFGYDVQTRVRRQIFEHHHGELVVGNADVVETGNETIPFLIVAPTMRVPMVLHDTVSPYLAVKAIFNLVKHKTFLSGSLKGQTI